MEPSANPAPVNSGAPCSPSAAAIAEAKPFEPRHEAGLEGILIAAQGASRPHTALQAIALDSLTNLVRRATDWPTAAEDIEARIGDYRFLIVEFRTTGDRIAYAQIWSEPDSELIMEVGPGPRDDPAERAFADRVRPALAGRGFQIAGNANNFRKDLPTPKPGDSLRIANELLSLLTDVLGYDGVVDLAYQLKQSTFLEAAHVTHGIARSGLRDLLKCWGLKTVSSPDDPTALDAHSHGFDFLLQLTAPLKGKRETFWEIHLHAVFEFPRERVPDLIREVNDKPRLLKACALEDAGATTLPVRLAHGINLAGGVTLAHIKSQIFEWIEAVHHIWTTWRTPAPSVPAEIAEDAPPRGTLH